MGINNSDDTGALLAVITTRGSTPSSPSSRDEKPLSRVLVAPSLDPDVQHRPVLIDGARLTSTDAC